MNGPIRVLQITHDLAIGGLQQVVLNLCRSIDRNRFHITVLCLRELGELSIDIEKLGIRTILLPKKENGTDYLSFIKVAKILKNENIQVIHSHNTQPLFDGTMGSIYSGRKHRIIHTDHGRQFPDKVRYMVAEWGMSHFIHKIVGVSTQTTEYLRKHEKLNRNKLMTIENGIDGNVFNIVINVKKKREDLNLPPSGPVIGVISRLEKVKGIIFLLQAMSEIIQIIPDITLIIVGEGSEMEELQRACSRLCIKKNVVFTGRRNDIPEILKILDVYILPSLSEGLPIGILEAMASGCPVVASRVGGIPQVLEDKKSALLVDPANKDMLANAIIELIRNIEYRKRIANTALNTFNTKYSSTIMANKYMELYV